MSHTSESMKRATSITVKYNLSAHVKKFNNNDKYGGLQVIISKLEMMFQIYILK